MVTEPIASSCATAIFGIGASSGLLFGDLRCVPIQRRSLIGTITSAPASELPVQCDNFPMMEIPIR